jgi:transcriptional regulator
MHPSSAFRVEDKAALLAHLDLHPLMTFAAVVEGRPVVAHAPVVVRRQDHRLILDFHLSRGNLLTPHVASGFHAVAVSLGPDAYVSPDWYAAPDQVPSWNYLSVEAEGPVTPMDEAGLIRHLDDLSAQEEARLLPKKPWTRYKMVAGKFETMLRGIVGASLAVERFEGTFKLSQNKTAADRAGVVEALGEHPIGRRMAQL